jgi:hypothetical protein
MQGSTRAKVRGSGRTGVPLFVQGGSRVTPSGSALRDMRAMVALRAEMDAEEMRVLGAQLDAEMRLHAARRGRGGRLGSPVRPALPSSCRLLCLKYN